MSKLKQYTVHFVVRLQERSCR